MDKVTIQDDQVAPLDAIAPGLEGLRIVFVNVFGIRNADDSWTLIDAGIPGSTSRILHWAEERFASAPNAIVLTHGHFDHVGAADELSKEWGVPIYAHPLEFPYLTGEKEYPAPNVGAGGGLMSLLSPIYPRGPIDVSGRLKALPALGGNLSVAELPSWQLLQTPGHTPGHVSLGALGRICHSGCGHLASNLRNRPAKQVLRSTLVEPTFIEPGALTRIYGSVCSPPVRNA